VFDTDHNSISEEFIMQFTEMQVARHTILVMYASAVSSSL